MKCGKWLRCNVKLYLSRFLINELGAALESGEITSLDSFIEDSIRNNYYNVQFIGTTRRNETKCIPIIIKIPFMMNLKLWLLSKKVKFTKFEIIVEFLGHSLGLFLAERLSVEDISMEELKGGT